MHNVWWKTNLIKFSGGIVLFYFIFFSALAALFAICMYGLGCTLSDKYPTYQLDKSLIGTNPGLGFRPYSSDVEKHGSLIWYVASNETNLLQWTNVLDEFLVGKKPISAFPPLWHSPRAPSASLNRLVYPARPWIIHNGVSKRSAIDVTSPNASDPAALFFLLTPQFRLVSDIFEEKMSNKIKFLKLWLDDLIHGSNNKFCFILHFVSFFH